MAVLCGCWLLAELRQTESRGLIDRILLELKPVAAQISETEALNQFGEADSQVNGFVKRLFKRLPALREVTIRDARNGLIMSAADGGKLVTHPTNPLVVNMVLTADNPDVGSLHEDDQEFLLIRYQILSPSGQPTQLEFGFNRDKLQSIVRSALSPLKESILLYSAIGTASILVAFGIALYAARQVRRLESYHQEIYRRAYLTEIGASLVHELRNPLSAIRSNIKALLVSPDETPEIVAELDKELMVLSNKLTGFLNLTRESNEDFKRVDLPRLIGDVVRLADPVAREKGLHIRAEVGDGLPSPMAHEALLRDAFLNLLINAVCSGQTEGEIVIRARGGGVDSITVEIEDQGEGIPPGSFQRIFEPFYTTRAEGTGLGLAIVKRIIENHRGTIHAENLSQGGARFSITLPLQQTDIPKWWKALKTSSRI